jgi:recombinational DNA repair protein RecR
MVKRCFNCLETTVVTVFTVCFDMKRIAEVVCISSRKNGLDYVRLETLSVMSGSLSVNKHPNSNEICPDEEVNFDNIDISH